MPSNQEFSYSPGSGRLKKKKKIRYRKKRSFFSKKRIWKLLFNPLTVILLIAFLAALTYFSLPPNKESVNKWKVRSDSKTKEVNQRLQETDTY